MANQSAPPVYILLRRTLGDQIPRKEGKKPSPVYISKGELLLEIPPKEQIPREDGTPAHNYCMYHYSDVTMYDGGANVSPLHDAQADYLEAIETPSARAQEYLKPDKLDWIMDLRNKDIVFCQIEKKAGVPLMLRGKVRYYGRIQEHRGVMFGLQIVDKEHRGKGTTDGSPYFQCGYKNAVYVSMDKIIKKTDVSSDDNMEELKEPDNIIQEQPTSYPAHHTRSKDNQYGEGLKKEGVGLVKKAKALLNVGNQAPSVVPDSTSHVDSQFSEGNRVVVQTVREKAITGIVRWVGPVKTSKETGGIVVPVVGIETDKKIVVSKEFPDLHYELTGSHGHHLFNVAYNHSRVFLPEQLVLHIDEYTKQKQENNTYEVQEAKKWTISIEEYRAQNEMMSKGNESRDKEFNTRVNLPENQQINEENLAVGGKPDDPMRLGESITQIVGEDNIREQQEEYKRIQRENKRRKSEDFELQDNPTSALNRPNEGQQFSLPSNPHQSQNQAPSSQGHIYANINNPDPGQHHSPSVHHHDPSSSQQRSGDPGSSSQRPVGDMDHALSRFTIGTMVQVRSQTGVPIHGMIQWIGTLPDHNGLYAGVELDYPMERCGDGSWGGLSYFRCQPGKGLFCLLGALEQDTRYLEPNQIPAAVRQELKNPLEEKAPLSDDEDTQVGPDLFNKYIGDEHGIQGHHNSCYLDATVFGLFALSDSFDMMLLEEPKHEVGQKIKHILWKGIVNPLRKYGLARHESIMELRNELEKLGRMKGANKDEKDPEEFLNLLFKEILHVEPFISIKRPFGVEKEYFVQLFFEIDPQQNTIPTTENLILKMFREQQISFTRVPSKLLLQMPRFGKEFKMYNRIIPSLEMDVKPLLDPSARGIQECHFCKELTAIFFCSTCATELFKTEEPYLFLCSGCSELAHRSRKGHKVEEIEVKEIMGDTSKFSKMQLLSVICIETSHYVCYTRTTNNRWLFHDSMANRLYDMYNIPKVTEVSRDLQHWVYDEKNHQKLLQAASKDIPEYVRRFTQDIYMCVYVNTDMDRYGTGSLPPEITSQVQSSHPLKQDLQLPPTPNSAYQRSSSNPEDQYYQQQYDDHNRQHNPVISGANMHQTQHPVAKPRKPKITEC